MTKNEMIEIMFNDKSFKEIYYMDYSSTSIEEIYEIYIKHLSKIRETKIDNILKSI